MNEDIVLLSKVLDKILSKSQSTSSKTEKIKYICALLALEECLFEYNVKLSDECRRIYNQIINDWNV